MALRSLAKKVYGSAFYHVELPRVYKEAAQKPIEPNKVVFVMADEPSFSGKASQIALQLALDGNYIIKARGLRGSERSLRKRLDAERAVIEEVATAEYVLAETRFPVLSAISMRPETQLAYVDGPEFSESKLECMFGPLAQRKMKMSIVVPAYNAMPELTRALDVLETQVANRDDVEVIIVDDGSTDATRAEAERYAAKHPHMFKVISLDEPSGSPAKPRNVGIDAAQGDYVFFLDADDFLGADAVELMMQHAREWVPDVMLVKFVSDNGRPVPKSMYTQNRGNVDIFTWPVMRTVSPIKLYSRRFLNEHALRFSENARPEDFPFVLRAYMLADRVAVAADSDYYHVYARDEGDHASIGNWLDLEKNVETYTDLLAYIMVNTTKEQRNAHLMPRLFSYDLYYMLLSIARNYSGEKQQRYFEQITALFKPYWEPAMCKGMTPEERMVIEAAFTGGLETLVALTANAPILDACAFTCREDGAVICSFAPDSASAIEVDVTALVPFRCVPEHVALDGAVLHMSGSMDVFKPVVELFGDLGFTLVLKANQGDVQFTFPAQAHELASSTGSEQTRDRDMSVFSNVWEACAWTWETELDLKTLEKRIVSSGRSLTKGTSLAMFMRVSCKNFSKDVRLGAAAPDDIRTAYERMGAQMHDMAMKPFCTEYNNFSLRLE